MAFGGREGILRGGGAVMATHKCSLEDVNTHREKME